MNLGFSQESSACVLSTPVKWEPCDKILPRNAYEKTHYDQASEYLVMGVVNKPDSETFVRANQFQYLSDILHHQQVYGVDDSYSPVLKATEVILMTAIAAEHGCNIYKTDTKLFLYGDLEEYELIYIADIYIYQAPRLVF